MKRTVLLFLLFLLCACNTSMVGQKAPDVGIDAEGHWLLLAFFSPT